MPAKIYIVSGFLGAGKTTFIQKMIRESFSQQKVVLIENDFGDISVDSALLQSSGVEVKEISSGCICCSLSGDFAAALQQLLKEIQPDIVVIEPSGVGKLSDILRVCEDERISSLGKVQGKIAVVDVKRCSLYLDNFGEFFEDQIEHADSIVFSRVEEFSDKVRQAEDLVRELNAQAKLFSVPWETLDMQKLLRENSISHQNHNHKHDCACHSTHEHNDESCHDTYDHGHEHGCACKGNHHHAEDVFDTVTLPINNAYSKHELEAFIEGIQNSQYGNVVRAKGIVPTPDGYMNVQYVTGEMSLTPSDAKGNVLCIIGENLKTQKIKDLFEKG